MFEWKLQRSSECSLYVREEGSGPFVVLLHGGFGSDHSVLLDLFEPLTEQYRFVFFDQHGSLRSPCSNFEHLSLDRILEELHLLIEELPAETVLLFGHSMGGYLAARYVREHPEDVEGIGMLNSMPLRLNEETYEEEIKPSLREMRNRPEVEKILDQHDLDPDRKSNYADRKAGKLQQILCAAECLSNVRNWKNMSGSYAYNGKVDDQIRRSMDLTYDLVPEIRNWGGTVEVIHGSDDYIPVQLHKQWITNVENTRLDVIDGVGHMSWFDRPKRVRSSVQNSLSLLKASKAVE